MAPAVAERNDGPSVALRSLPNLLIPVLPLDVPDVVRVPFLFRERSRKEARLTRVLLLSMREDAYEGWFPTCLLFSDVVLETRKECCSQCCT
jgi:hypothetical protein